MDYELKNKVLERYRKKKDKNKDKNKEKDIIEDFITVHSDSTLEDDYQDSPQEHTNVESTTPYFYIDYDTDAIQQAKITGYKTLVVDKNGLTDKNINDIITGQLFNFSDTHIIINLWRVLTKSNLTMQSYNCTEVDSKKFKNDLEKNLKWGSKIQLKNKMTGNERDEYSLFRDGVPDMLKKLYKKNVKIFIISNSHYSFVVNILKHYKLYKYVENIFTPSKCGLPHGKISPMLELFKDGRKINKTRMFVCIERYMGRLKQQSQLSVF